MKIAHYMPGMTLPGGIGSYIHRLAKAQREAGHEVLLLDDADEQRVLREAESDAVDVLHLHTSVDPHTRTRLTLVRTMHGHWPYCPSGSRYLKRSAVACERAYSLSGCLWGHVIDRCGSVRPLRLVEDFRRTWKEMSQPGEILTLAISEFVRQQMIRSGYRSDRIRVLHLPAPRVEAAAPHATDPVFLFLGRLVPEKGAAWLIRAFAKVQGDAQLQIAGDGPQRPALEELARSLGVAQRVQFPGWLDPEQTMQHLALARAVIVPSVWHEPAGLVTLEAAAAGKPAIVSSVGGIPEYAARLESCRIVKPNDEAALAIEIAELANDASMACDLGRIGRQNAQTRFGLESHLAQLDQAYADAKELRQ